MLIRRRSRLGVIGVLLALGLVGALFVACGGDDDAGDQGDMAMEDDAEEDGHDEMAMEDDAEEDGHDEMAMEDDAEEDGHDEMAMEDAEEGDHDEMAMDDAEESGAHVAGEHGAAEGVVHAQPDDSTRVTVTLREWAILSDIVEVEAGIVYFLVENQGPEHPHELLVIRSELGLGEFPVVDGAIPEDTLDIVDEIEEFASESWASIALDLKPGRYILLCNIVEIEEDGTLESHFELGMRVPFIVR